MSLQELGNLGSHMLYSYIKLYLLIVVNWRVRHRPESNTRPSTSSYMDHPIAKVRKEHGDSEQPARAQNGALACPFLHWMLLKFTHPVHLGILLDLSMRQTWIDISACLSGEIPLPCEALCAKHRCGCSFALSQYFPCCGQCHDAAGEMPR